MTWYKKAQSEIAFQAWLGKSLQEETKNYSQPVYGLPVKVPMIKKWYEQENPDLNKYTFDMALTATHDYFENHPFDEITQGLTPDDLNKDNMAKLIKSYKIIEFQGKDLTGDDLTITEMKEQGIIGHNRYYAVAVQYDHPAGANFRESTKQQAQLSTLNGELFFPMHI